MVFRSKINRVFSVFVYIVILIIGAGTILPALLLMAPVTGPVTAPVMGLVIALLLIFTFLIITGFLLWMVFSVTYIFREEYLLIKSGPFRSRISYKDITKVSPTKNVFTGPRMLSSRDSLEVFNNKTAFRSARISPIQKEEFIFELKNRNPNIQIEE